MRPKMTRLPRLAYPLCALGLLLLTGLALGFPTLYFSFSDQVSFSRVRVENISSGQIYLPANTEQTVQMIVEGSYTASNTDLSYSEMETRVRRCLETFAASDAALLGGWLRTLFLDNWEQCTVISYENLVGAGVFDDTVRTSLLCMASLELIAGDTEAGPYYLHLVFDPDDYTLYAFSLSGIPDGLVDEVKLEEGLRGYILEYLRLDPGDLRASEDVPLEGDALMGFYYDLYGPFLPDTREYGYRFFLDPVSIYWDGYTLAVNEN